MKLASLLFLQQMELAMCEAIFLQLKIKHIILNINSASTAHWIHAFMEAGICKSQPESFFSIILNRTLKRLGEGFTYLRLHFSNWLLTTLLRQVLSKVHLELIVQTGFPKEKCLPRLKTHPLDVLIDRSQKVTQNASPNNMCQQRLLGLPITSPKPGSQEYPS